MLRTDVKNVHRIVHDRVGLVHHSVHPLSADDGRATTDDARSAGVRLVAKSAGRGPAPRLPVQRDERRELPRRHRREAARAGGRTHRLLREIVPFERNVQRKRDDDVRGDP